MTLSNDRIFYACQAVNIGPANGTILYVQGIQSVGVSLATAPETLLDVGYAQQDKQRWGKPEYVINVSRLVPKGQDCLYESNGNSYSTNHLLKINGTGPAASSNVLQEYRIDLYYTKDDQAYVGQDTNSILSSYPRCVLQSLSYSLNVDGQLTEDATYLARTVNRSTPSYSAPTPAFPQTGQTIRRKDFNISSSAFPSEVTRYLNTGPTVDGQGVWGIQNFNINVDFDFREVTNYGEWGGSTDSGLTQNKWRQITLPVSVTGSITGVLRYDDTTSFSSVVDTAYSNNESLRIVLNDDGSNLRQFVLGAKNYLTGIEVSGGDTGGGNVEVTFNYQNDYSDFFSVSDAGIQTFTPSGGRF
jgi:hypothetical protein